MIAPANTSGERWWRLHLPVVIALGCAFAAMRGFGVLGPGSQRFLLPLGFVLMALAPWVMLDRMGRRAIGLVAPSRPSVYASAVLLGAMAALLCFGTGLLLFAGGPDNWFVTIANSYRGNFDTRAFARPMLYLIFTLPAVLFSPIGEEIFFRGVLQHALERRVSTRMATCIECAAFGLVHLVHHGIYLGATGIAVRPLSGALWVGLMFLVALLFATLRRRSGSLYPAIAAHMAFNAAMNVSIFAVLW